MRKGIFVCLILFFIYPLFSQKIPEQLLGIWEGYDRFLYFEQFPENENSEITLYLKEYYGWYIDPTAEPEKKSNKDERKRNSGTTKDLWHLPYKIEEIKNNDDTWVGNIHIKYSRTQNNCIPVCKIDNKMYLDFYIKNNKFQGFYMGNAVSKGITLNEQVIPENIYCYLIDEGKIFTIRYWKSGMDYSDETAEFTIEEKTYTVPKHVISGKTIYSCVSGRSKKVRNIKNYKTFEKDNYIWNKDNSVFIMKDNYYLYKLDEHTTYEDLQNIKNNQNSKRKPNPPPLFPPYGPEEEEWTID